MITSFCKTMTDFSFRGRSTKREVQYFLLLSSALSTLFLSLIFTAYYLILDVKITFLLDVTTTFAWKTAIVGTTTLILAYTLLTLYIVFFIWSSIMWGLLTIRRLHDLNSSGIYYWIWLTMVCSFGMQESILLSIFMFGFILSCIILLATIDSYPSTNKYGKIDADELIYFMKQHGY